MSEDDPPEPRPPAVGEIIYIPTQLHVSRGEDDIVGGRARVRSVRTEQLGGTPCALVEVDADPGTFYNWTTYLGPAQRALEAEHGAGEAHARPDHRPEFNVPIEREVPTQFPLVFISTHEPGVPYETFHRGQRWAVRVNDFPAEPLYTLLIDGEEIESFNEWPSRWKRPIPVRR